MVFPRPTHIVAAARARLVSVPAWVLIVEIFIGAGWLRAFTEKLISLDWWRGETLAGFLVETDAARVPWFHLVTDVVVWPNLTVISGLVAGAQLLIGGALLAGRFRVPALLGGMALNVAFVLAGAVNPSVFYLVAQLALLLWVIERPETPRAGLLASLVGVAGLAIAGSAALAIGTVHPGHVIEDPGAVLVFLGALAAVGAERARLGRQAPPVTLEERRLVDVRS